MTAICFDLGAAAIAYVMVSYVICPVFSCGSKAQWQTVKLTSNTSKNTSNIIIKTYFNLYIMLWVNATYQKQKCWLTCDVFLEVL